MFRRLETVVTLTVTRHTADRPGESTVRHSASHGPKSLAVPEEDACMEALPKR